GNLSVDVYSPIWIDRNKPEAAGSRGFYCFARLRPGASLESAQAEMTLLAAQVGEEYHSEKEFGAVVFGLRDFLTGDSRPILFILAGVVTFVLLIACANLASLLLTRGVGRRNELAVRAALGASRPRILQQLIAESAVIGLSGGALGLLVGWAGSRLLVLLAHD